MLIAIVLILVILWLLGISIPNIDLFTINNYPVTLWNILILAVICWAIGILPRPFQAIAGVLLILWVLSVLGILAISGLSNVIVLAIIIAIAIAIFL